MSARSEERATVSLRAARGSPLLDDEVRRIVLSSAEAIAERTGVRLVELDSDGVSVTATLAGPAIVALGFAAELRRTTERWHRSRFGTALWGEPS